MWSRIHSSTFAAARVYTLFCAESSGKTRPFSMAIRFLRVHGVVFGLALGRNLVVGLGEDAIEGSKRRIKTVSAKREYLGHEFSGALQHDCRN